MNKNKKVVFYSFFTFQKIIHEDFITLSIKIHLVFSLLSFIGLLDQVLLLLSKHCFLIWLQILFCSHDRTMAKEFTCLQDILAFRKISCGLTCAEVMTLHIQIVTFKESMQPSTLIQSLINTIARLEHHIIIFCFDWFLVFKHCIIDFLIKVHFSTAALFCLEMHESQTIFIRFEAFDIFELWTHNILNSKSTFKQELYHCVGAWTVLLCHLHDFIKFFITIVLMTSFSNPNNYFLQGNIIHKLN